jgi:ABC-2 type transport system permease protein
MTRLFAGELIKVRTTRTALGFGLAAVLLTLASVLVSILAGDPLAADDKRAALDFGGTVAFVLLIYGVVGATGEFRHQTLAPAVLIAPDRFRLVLARIGAYGVSAGVFAVAMGIVAFGIGVPLLADSSGASLGSSDYLSVAAGGLISAVLCASLGVGIGTLVRNQVASVVGVFAWLLVLEPLVGLIGQDWSNLTIGTAASALGTGGNSDTSGLTAALVLAAWVAVLSFAGALVDRRRDVD